MMTRHKARTVLTKLILDRKGVAEIVGSIMFLLILLFFFTNVYLWHDTATRQMDDVMATKINSPVVMSWANESFLVVRNTGGVGVGLSRLWITTSSEPPQHLYADLESITGHTGSSLWVEPGATMIMELNKTAHAPYPSPIQASWDGTRRVAIIDYVNTTDTEVFIILTTTGNMATPSSSSGDILIIPDADGGAGSSAAIGSVVIAGFDSFSYYTVQSQGQAYTINMNGGQNGYLISSGGNNVLFGVELTNIDSDQRAVSLNANSQLFFIDTVNPTKVGYLVFHAVNVVRNGNTGTIQQTYSPISLPYNVPTTVYFAAKNPVVNSFTPNSLAGQGQVDAGVYPLNLALLGSIGVSSVPFGQNIPFVSVYVAS